VTPVLRQEDVGHDLQCVLHVPVEDDNKLIHAGPAFAVQVKSNHDDLVYEKDYERKWIGEQDNPFFVCVVNRAELTCEIYSTWNLLNGILKHGTGKHPGQKDSPSRTKKVVLKLGSLGSGAPADRDTSYPYGGISFSGNGTLTIPLGPPILCLTPDRVKDLDSAKACAMVLKEWVDLDRANIVRVAMGMYWIRGPKRAETDRPAWSSGEVFEGIYSNINNLFPDADHPHRPTVVENFVASAYALKRVIEEFDRNELPRPLPSEHVNALENVLNLCAPSQGN